MSREFVSMLEPTRAVQPWEIRHSRVNLVKDSFKLRTLLVLGALAQIGLLKLLPYKLALVPCTCLALHSVITTIIQSVRGSRGSDFMQGVVTGRTTTQIPYAKTGLFGHDPAVHPIVVFHFGARFNHPLGVLCPGGNEITTHFKKCIAAVQDQAEEYGLLGITRWQSADRDTHNTIMMVFYFQDVEGLHKFAHDKVHRDAWDWVNKGVPEHIGFFHETFCVPRKAYETLYTNMPPTLFGQARVRCETDEDKKEWTSTLISADSAQLRGQYGRMGRGGERNSKES
ncbi:hypothetical protein F5B20DRAFT_581750 [Whalleya microplaca]|nr:hypothetical protein F5B20DRAFT_581750 [Whalleya microplaca]